MLHPGAGWGGAVPISHLPNVAPCSGTWLCQAPCPSRDVWGCWVRMHHEGFSQHFPCTQVPWKSPSSGVDQERELPQRFSPHCTKTLGMPPVAPTSPNSIPTLLLRHYPHLSVWICLVVEKVKSLNHQSLEAGGRLVNKMHRPRALLDEKSQVCRFGLPGLLQELAAAPRGATQDPADTDVPNVEPV